MAHPQMFERADPYLGRVREICLALPGADEKVSHGRPTFFTTKVFVTYGGTVKGDHDPEPHRQSRPRAPRRRRTAGAARGRALLSTRPTSARRAGLGLDLRACGAPEEVDWQEVAELVDASYRLTAPARLVRELDAG